MRKNINWRLLQIGITKRNHFKKLQFESQNLLKGIFKNDEVLYFLVEITPDEQFIYRQVNDAFERITLLSSKEICGKTIEEYYPDDVYGTKKFILSNYQHVLKIRQPFTFEEMIPFRGIEYWWLTQLSPLRDHKERICQILGVSTLISDRKKYQNELHQSNERYRFLAENARDMIYRISLPEGAYEYASPATYEVLGYTPEELYQSPSLIRQICHPDWLDYYDDQWKNLLEGIVPPWFEYKIKQKNGQTVWIHQNNTLVKDGEGKPEALIGVVHEITDRKLVELALQESETRFRSLFQESPIPIWVEDYSAIKKKLEDIKSSGISDMKSYLEKHPDLVNKSMHPVRILDANQATVRVHRMFSIEALMRSFNTLCTPADIQSSTDEMLNINDGKREFEGISITSDPNGGKKYLSFKWVVAPGYETTYARVFVSAIDITQRVKAEENLRRSEERYRRLFEGAVVGIFQANLDGKNIEVNPAHARMHGYNSPEEVMALSGDLAHTLYADPNRCDEVMQKILNSTSSIECENTYLRKDGSTFSGVLHAWKTKDALGKPLYIEGFIEDISDRKKTEEALSRRFKEQMVLYAIANAGTEATSVDDLIAFATDITAETFGYSDFGVLLLNEQDHMLHIHPSFHTNLTVEKWLTPSPPGKGITGKVVQTGKSIRAGDVSKSANYIAVHPGTRSELCIPMKIDGEVLGVIDTESTEINYYNKDDLRFLTAVAQQLAIAIARVRLLRSLEEKISERTRHLSALSEISAISSQPVELNQVLTKSLERALLSVGCEIGVIHLLQEDNGVLKKVVETYLGSNNTVSIEKTTWARYWKKIVSTNEAVHIPMILSKKKRGSHQTVDAPTYSYLGVPIRSLGKSSGMLSIIAGQNHPYTEGDLALLNTIGDQIGASVENALLRKKNEELALIEERNRLARDLHDAVTQSLYSVTLISKGAHKIALRHKDAELHDYLQEISRISLQALKEMRLLIYELRPSTLVADGLEGALKKRVDLVEQRSGIDVNLHFDDSISLPIHVGNVLYRIAQEALNNILKHSGATCVSIRVSREHTQILMSIEDNGKGFDPKNITQDGFGLQSMRERTEKIGGTISIRSKPGDGTQVQIRLREEK